MQTTHLKGKQLASFDAALTDCLRLQPGTERSVGRTGLRIGIRNECGELYRVIGTLNAVEFLMAVDRLETLGFVSEPDRPARQMHCHTVMRPARLPEDDGGPP
jgi:hypothetical protein